MQRNIPEKIIRAFSYNCNSARIVEDSGSLAPAFPDLSFKARWKANKEFFMQILSKHSDTIFALQELDDKALIMVEVFFKEQGLSVYTTKYCLDPGSFNFLIAIPKHYSVEKKEQLYYTISGQSTIAEERKKLTKEEKIKIHLNTEFEKSAQILHLQTESTEHFVLVNTHPGLEQSHRIAAMEKLADYFEDEKKPIILVGDFNQFNTDKDYESKPICDQQIEKLKNKGFIWASENLLHSGLCATFLSYPYDIQRFFNEVDKAELKALQQANQPEDLRQFFLRKIADKEIRLLTTCLDATFLHGFESNKDQQIKVSVKPMAFFNNQIINTAKVETAKKFEAEFLQHFHDNPSSTEKPAPLPSDHFGLSTKIRMP